MKNKLYKLLFFIFCSFYFFGLPAQNTDTSSLKWNIHAAGYVKDLQYAIFQSNPDTALFETLLHNRFNFAIDNHKHFSMALQIRNRLFAGESTRQQTGLAAMLDKDKAYFDLSWVLVKSPALILHSQIDRVWADWNKNKWDIKIGRQRINWGINMVWNPNDIFNALNFVDFDYEERPGSDAVRIQYQLTNQSGFDLALSPGKDSVHHNAALLYRFNKWYYDFQILGGISSGDWVAGLGFAGNLGTAGLKGEISYFYPYYSTPNPVNNNLSASFSIDYAFKWGLYINSSFLFNSRGASKQNPLPVNTIWYNQDLKAKNLMPTKYSYFLQLSGNIHPLIRADIAGIYGPGLSIFFLMPSLSYNMADNLDLTLLGQIFYDNSSGQFRNMGNLVFLRLKWSF